MLGRTFWGGGETVDGNEDVVARRYLEEFNR